MDKEWKATLSDRIGIKETFQDRSQAIVMMVAKSWLENIYDGDVITFELVTVKAKGEATPL